MPLAHVETLKRLKHAPRKDPFLECVEVELINGHHLCPACREGFGPVSLGWQLGSPTRCVNALRSCSRGGDPERQHGHISCPYCRYAWVIQLTEVNETLEAMADHEPLVRPWDGIRKFALGPPTIDKTAGLTARDVAMLGSQMMVVPGLKPDAVFFVNPGKLVL